MNEPTFIFGCEQLGGYQWGDFDIKEVEHAIKHSIDIGINEFDTADCYGLGLSESRLGKLISSRRDRVKINTKFGVRIDNRGRRSVDNSINWIETALNNSLQRLKTEYIDLYLLHSWDNKTNLTLILDKLEEFTDKGKILNYGISNLNQVDNSIHRGYNLNSFSVEYSFIYEENKKYIIKYTDNNLRFMPYGVLAQGLLSGKYDIDSKFHPNDRRNMPKYRHFHGKRYLENQKKIKRLKLCATKLNLSCSALAVLYVKKAFQNTTPIVGIKNVEQLDDILQIRNINNSVEYMTELNNCG